LKVTFLSLAPFDPVLTADSSHVRILQTATNSARIGSDRTGLRA